MNKIGSGTSQESLGFKASCFPEATKFCNRKYYADYPEPIRILINLASAIFSGISEFFLLPFKFCSSRPLNSLKKTIVPSSPKKDDKSEGKLTIASTSCDSKLLLIPPPIGLTQEGILTSLFRELPALNSYNFDKNQQVALGLYWHMLPKQSGETYFYDEQENTPFKSREDWIEWRLSLDEPIHEESESKENNAREELGALYDAHLEPHNLTLKIAEMIAKRKIVITTPADEIMEIFNKYKVIQLRPLEHNTLVIGCGHGNHSWSCNGGGRMHLHEGADTVNIEIGMNPSVVAKWGLSQNNEYFSGKNYREILDEGPISLFMKDRLDNFFITAQLALRSDGSLFLPSHIKTIDYMDGEIDWDFFDSMKKIASQYGFFCSGYSHRHGQSRFVSDRWIRTGPEHL